MAKSTQICRRTFLKGTVGTACLAALGMTGFSVQETYDIRAERVTIHLPRLPQAFDGFRLVQISDVHFGDFTYERHLRRIVQLVNAQQPDLILLTGDYVTAPTFGSRRRAAERIWPAVPALKDLRAARAVLATLGNHDHSSNPYIITEALEDAGIQVLANRSLPIEAEGQRWWLAGLDDALESHADVQRTLKNVPAAEECVVAAVHEPDIAVWLCRYSIDFQISGHSHGGQVRLPGIGPIYLPRMARRFAMGYYRVNRLQLYTNRGVGVIHLPIRFLCPPEITVFTLRSGPGG